MAPKLAMKLRSLRSPVYRRRPAGTTVASKATKRRCRKSLSSGAMTLQTALTAKQQHAQLVLSLIYRAARWRHTCVWRGRSANGGLQPRWKPTRTCAQALAFTNSGTGCWAKLDLNAEDALHYAAAGFGANGAVTNAAAGVPAHGYRLRRRIWPNGTPEKRFEIDRYAAGRRRGDHASR